MASGDFLGGVGPRPDGPRHFGVHNQSFLCVNSERSVAAGIWRYVRIDHGNKGVVDGSVNGGNGAV